MFSFSGARCPVIAPASGAHNRRIDLSAIRQEPTTEPRTLRPPPPPPIAEVRRVDDWVGGRALARSRENVEGIARSLARSLGRPVRGGAGGSTTHWSTVMCWSTLRQPAIYSEDSLDNSRSS